MLYGAISQLQAATRLYTEIHGQHPLDQDASDAGAFALKCLVVDHLVLSRQLMASSAVLPCFDETISCWRSHLTDMSSTKRAPGPTKPDRHGLTKPGGLE